MLTPNTPSLHAATPSLRAIDSRGLNVREILYHRCEPGAADARVTRHDHDAHGRLVQSIDPRLYAAQVDDPRVRANLQQRFSLSGKLLLSQSIDAGCRIKLDDGQGRVAMTWPANGVQQTQAYEAAPLPGRLMSRQRACPWACGQSQRTL